MDIRQHAVVALITLLTTACGGGGGGSSDPETPAATSVVTAFYSKAPVDGATCNLHGTNDQVIAGPASSTTGAIEFAAVTYAGDVYTQCSGGSYIDESTGLTVQLSNQHILHSVTNTIGGSSTTVHQIVSPLTELAYRNAITSGSSSSATMATKANEIADIFGLDNIDITQVQPSPLNTITGNTSNNDRYGIVLAAISQMQEDAKTISTAPTGDELVTLITQIESDINTTGFDSTSYTQSLTNLTSNTNTNNVITDITSISNFVDTTTTTPQPTQDIAADILGTWKLELISGDVTISFDSSGRGENKIDVPGYQIETRPYSYRINGNEIFLTYDETGVEGTPSDVISLSTTELILNNADNTTGTYTKITTTNTGASCVLDTSGFEKYICYKLDSTIDYYLEFKPEPTGGLYKIEKNTCLSSCNDPVYFQSNWLHEEWNHYESSNLNFLTQYYRAEYNDGISSNIRRVEDYLSDGTDWIDNLNIWDDGVNLTGSCISGVIYNSSGQVIDTAGPLVENSLPFQRQAYDTGFIDYPLCSLNSNIPDEPVKPATASWTTYPYSSSVTHTIGGTTSGLNGTVVLQNFGGDNLTVTSNGSFTFSTARKDTSAYSVSVLTHPTEQVCSVTNGSGTLAGADVIDVSIACVDSYHSVGGSISGLTGAVTLQNNNGDNLTVSATGSFLFATKLYVNSNYSVSVLTNPSDQICSVSNGNGIVLSADISSVSIECISTTPTNITINSVSSTQNDLAWDAVGSAEYRIYWNTSGNPTTADAFISVPSGTISYSHTGLDSSLDYFYIIVSVIDGTSSTPSITIKDKITIGGTVTGLINSQITLQNNATDDLIVSIDGSFTFPQLLDAGSTYNVTILNLPIGHSCPVTNGTGTANSDINNVSIVCTVTKPSVTLSLGIKQLQFNWSAVSGATYYKLMENPDGVSGFTQVGTNLTTTSTEVDIAVYKHDWSNARYYVSACDANGCIDSSEVVTTGEALNAIGYFKTSTLDATDGNGQIVSISLDGKTLAIGKPNEDSRHSSILNVGESDNGAPGSGAVFIFAHNGTNWEQQAYLKASNTGADDSFGSSISLDYSGNTLVVGAPNEDSNSTAINTGETNDSAINSGAAYVFSRSGTSWTQQAYIKSSDTENFSSFGDTVEMAYDGNTVLVTSPNQNDPTNTYTNMGAVFSFTRSGSVWTQEARIGGTHPVNPYTQHFGSSMSYDYSSGTLAVGSTLIPSAIANGTAGTGVYVFTRSGSSWTQQAFIDENVTYKDQYSASVAVSGDTLVVGSPLYDGTYTDSGLAYVYTRSLSTWTKTATFGPTTIAAGSTAEGGNQFGHDVAILNNDMAIASKYEDGSAVGILDYPIDNTVSNSGAVYIYEKISTTWTYKSQIKALNTEANDYFASSISLGLNSLAVGADGEDGFISGVNGDYSDNSKSYSGAAYLY